MKECWYGDDRDLVKWGSLIRLAETQRVKSLIQVLFLTASSPPPLLVDGKTVPFPGAVWGHFRDLRAILQLPRTFPADMRLFDQPFTNQTRAAYISTLLGVLGTMDQTKIVFLDPDTGMAPKRAADRHVTLGEIASIWASLNELDWLVLYQHSFRRTTWKVEAQRRFSAACGGAQVRVMESPQAASDVVLLAARK